MSLSTTLPISQGPAQPAREAASPSPQGGREPSLIGSKTSLLLASLSAASLRRPLPNQPPTQYLST